MQHQARSGDDCIKLQNWRKEPPHISQTLTNKPAYQVTYFTDPPKPACWSSEICHWSNKSAIQSHTSLVLPNKPAYPVKYVTDPLKQAYQPVKYFTDLPIQAWTSSEMFHRSKPADLPHISQILQHPIVRSHIPHSPHSLLLSCSINSPWVVPLPV